MALTAGTAVIVAQVSYEGEMLTAGVLADEVHEVLELDASKIEAAPSFGSRLDESFVKGIGRHGDGFVILLDLERALSGAAASALAVRTEGRE
jgi:chemotaxis signal transduction protein